MKRWCKGNVVYYGLGLCMCVCLSVGLLSLLVDKEIEERKRPYPIKSVQEEENESGKEKAIRVVIKTNGFKEVEHKEVVVRAKSGMCIRSDDQTRECKPNEEIKILPDDKMFQKGAIQILPKEGGDKINIVSLKRGYGAPEYRGKLELHSTEKGIAIVNELPLEEYLYAVVPSEMPASYSLEALKVQAVCARSYAEKQTKGFAYPQYKAHVDDSTEYQVYGNSREQESTIRAVNETKGEKVWYNGEVATTYYFSTSCGKTTTSEAWGSQRTKQNAYLCSIDVAENGKAYEKDLPWYRWSAKIPEKVLENLIEKNTKTDIGKLCNVQVTKRGAGNVALQLVATGDKKKVTVDTENKIRRALGGDGYLLERQDGKKVKSMELLPSAFFEIKKQGKEYVLTGGGYGHGIGMSQTGANEMAKRGKNYKEILSIFYKNIEVRK